MKSKYLFGSIIIFVFLGLMVYFLTQSNIKYENNFVKVEKLDRTVKATGSWVKDKGYDMDKQDMVFRFYMADQSGNIMKVVYHGAIPNNFESAPSIVVTGKYQDGCFNANDILTKCPSKYQDQGIKSTSL
jgi:cytochrome c-type biogenesis protein CcmE